MLSKDSLFGALRTVNAMWAKAERENNMTEIKRWKAERERILARITDMQMENNND